MSDDATNHDDADSSNRPLAAARTARSSSLAAVRDRAAQLAAWGELLARGVVDVAPERDVRDNSAARPVFRAPAPRPTAIGNAAPASDDRLPPASVAHPIKATRTATSERSDPARSSAPLATSSGEPWLRRQGEILSRVDDTLRRVRELQESPGETAATFTDPDY